MRLTTHHDRRLLGHAPTLPSHALACGPLPALAAEARYWRNDSAVQAGRAVKADTTCPKPYDELRMDKVWRIEDVEEGIGSSPSTKSPSCKDRRGWYHTPVTRRDMVAALG